MDKDYLTFKRAPIGPNVEDYDVLCGGDVVGRIFLSQAAPQDRQWMWTLAYGQHEDRTPTHGYEPTREAADGGVRQVMATGIGRADHRCGAMGADMDSTLCPGLGRGFFLRKGAATDLQFPSGC